MKSPRGERVDPQFVLENFRRFAVVGATTDPLKYGHEVMAALLRAGIEVFPVNPRYQEVLGRPCYPSLDALPQPPDVVVTAVRSDVTEAIVDQCARLGYGLVWMPPGCWSHAALNACHRAHVGLIFDHCPVDEVKILGTSARESAAG